MNVLSSISRRHGFSVVSRVMLERRDYLQELVDLGCKPKVLGTVTYNPVTRKVDVSGSVYLYDKGLTRLPFAFGEVGRDFGCSGNRLTSLEGAPREVGGDFWCFVNRLVSLEGAPVEVGGNFKCYNNRLTSLEGAPSRVGGSFICSVDGLQDVSALKHCKIEGTLWLYGPEADQERAKKMLRAQGYEGRIE
jgi:hypothetical protein